jgi:hypothetical protein
LSASTNIVSLRGEMAELAEGGGLLNRYSALKRYRGFESLSLRHDILLRLCVTARDLRRICKPPVDNVVNRSASARS